MLELDNNHTLFELEDFVDNVMIGAISDYDGWGYYSDGKYLHDDVNLYELVNSDISKIGYKYVAWVNK